jgi:hypothetical protein
VGISVALLCICFCCFRCVTTAACTILTLTIYCLHAGMADDEDVGAERRLPSKRLHEITWRAPPARLCPG